MVKVLEGEVMEQLGQAWVCVRYAARRWTGTGPTAAAAPAEDADDLAVLLLWEFDWSSLVGLSAMAGETCRAAAVLAAAAGAGLAGVGATAVGYPGGKGSVPGGGGMPG